MVAKIVTNEFRVLRVRGNELEIEVTQDGMLQIWICSDGKRLAPVGDPQFVAPGSTLKFKGTGLKFSIPFRLES